MVLKSELDQRLFLKVRCALFKILYRVQKVLHNWDDPVNCAKNDCNYFTLLVAFLSIAAGFG